MQKAMDESKKTVSLGEELSKSKHGSIRVPIESPPKSTCQVFMFGFGTGKFPSKMELSDIKKRQLRQQTIDNTVSDGGEVEIVRRRSGKKRWWLLIDVFGCGGGYGREVAVKDFQESFHTLKRFD